MIWIGIVCVFLFLVLLLIFFSTIRIGFYYKREAHDDRIKVEIGLFNGLIPLRVNIPSLSASTDGIEYKENIQSKQQSVKKEKRKLSIRDIRSYREKVNALLENVRGLNRILRRFFAKIQVIRFTWTSRIGTGDAAETGILSGMVWGIKSIIVHIIARFLKLKTTPQISIEPSFMQACLYTELECIVRFRVGNAIIAGLLILMHLRKGSKVLWQNTQSKGL